MKYKERIKRLFLRAESVRIEFLTRLDFHYLLYAATQLNLTYRESRRSAPSIRRASLEIWRESIRYRDVVAGTTATKKFSMNDPKDGCSGAFWFIMFWESPISDVESGSFLTVSVLLAEITGKQTYLDAAIRSPTLSILPVTALAYGLISTGENESCQTTARGVDGVALRYGVYLQ
ncbi:hypothetical protein Moror_7913 [Moniliophthora roreri MCA 2997]|uniref:Uncharacterized protein n=1 Tax=Moniliophthora roreri (strain MCA 2997) TaxID=1381753 RepID=V2WT36_MONRO|nr:hypothetical protein Moror_7913 [Moniliophthora roreri MCA 2997]